MKTHISTFLILIFLMSPLTTKAIQQPCLIQDGPAPVLSNYIKNNRIIIKNIEQAIQKNKNKQGNIAKTIDYSKNLITRTFNEIATIGSYMSYFTYYIIYPNTNEIPQEIKRDHQALESENERFTQYLKNLIQKGYADTKITEENICRGIKGTCNLSGNIGNIIGKLIKNNTKILDLYREIVMSQGGNIKNIPGEIMLIDKNPEDFTNQLKEYYGNSNSCVSSKGNFLGTILKKIKNIQIINKRGTQGVQEWKNAWGLVTGINNPAEKELEKKLLIQELTKQGVSSNAAESAVKTLDTFNEEGYSWSNNPLSNSFQYIYQNTAQQYDTFKKGLFDKPSDGKQKKISNVLSEKRTNEIDLQIATKISKLYSSQIPYTANNEEKTNNLKARITDLYNNLNISIKTLDETCEYAVKVCNDQGRGIGFCGNCD